MDDRSVIRRFGRLFFHDKVYRISGFLVRVNHDPVHTKYHLSLEHTSCVELWDANLPEHCWDLVTVPHVLSGLVTGEALVGLCFVFLFVN